MFATKVKKGIAILAVFCILLAMLPSAAFASQFTDMPDGWSKIALENAVGNGLLNGDNGRIMPKDHLTRAQMAAVLNRAFGASEKASLSSFTDVAAGAWYYEDMAKAVQMKVFEGSGNKLNPGADITREEAFAALARVFKLSGAPQSSLDKFRDKASVSQWAQDGTASLVSAGYIGGSNGKLNPKSYITRAEFAQIMDNLLKKYIKSAGTYKTDITGNAMINVPDVTLKDVTVKGDLIIGDGVGNGNITLDGVVVTGRTVVRGGGIHSIKVIGNSNIPNIVIARVDGQVRVYSEDGAQIGEVVIDGNDDVIIEGEVGSVSVTAPDVTVTATGATIASATIEGKSSSLVVGANSIIKSVKVEAENATITASAGSTVQNVVVNSNGANINGNGVVGNVAANASNVAVTTPGTSVAAAPGTTGVKAGSTDVTAGTTSVTTGSTGTSTSGSTGSTGDDSGDSTVPVSSIAVTGQGGVTTITVHNGTLQMNAAISPADASDKSVTWSVTNTDGTPTDKATISGTGLLTAAKDGQVKVTATSVSTPAVKGESVVTLSNQTLHTYTVTFAAGTSNNDLADITSAANYVATATVTEGVAYTTPVLSEEGYTFNGWFTNAACTTVYVAGPTAITANITLYARFTISGTPVSTIVVTGQGLSETISEYGGTLQMYTTISPSNATNKTVTWSVTNTDGTATDKATISGTGLLTALKDGQVKVTATSVSTPAVKGELVITLSNQTLHTYTVTFAPGTSNNDLSNITGAANYVATATATQGVAYTAPVLSAEGYTFNGWFTDAACTAAYAAGPGVITADITLYAKFAVINVPVSSITVTGAGNSTTVVNGGTLQMDATVSPSSATNKTITWSVAPGTGTATISSDGLLSATSAGTVIVIATNTASGVTGTQTITVIVPDLTAPTLSNGTVEGLGSADGSTAVLKFQATQENGTVKYYHLVQDVSLDAPDASAIKAAGHWGTVSGNPTVYQINLYGLTAGHNYNAFIVMDDASNNTSNILAITGINPYSNSGLTKLNAPSVTLSPDSSGSGGLTYTVSANLAQESDIKEYSVVIALESSPETPIVTYTVSKTNLTGKTFLVNGITAGISYVARVRAVVTDGNATYQNSDFSTDTAPVVAAAATP